MSQEPPSSPTLPAELWLQVLENITDLDELWTVIRHVSPTFKSYVERMFISTHLPNTSGSISLPFRDPATGTPRYPRYPDCRPEVLLAFTSLSADQSHMVLATSTTAQNGATMEALNAKGVLTRERLDEAALWIWIGCNRGRGVSIEVPRRMAWDEAKKVWMWEVRWRSLVSTYFDMRKNRGRTKVANARACTSS
ncbi:hypothetical protein BDV95DRAFT_480473 [Massariosphaeria phaeospora]|uniref:F-box domain-containing protein n=1 Tax=Massariosphaeria phaeospora TaxID=100035 RepID=A0A7C8IIC3_9PLEO|nr:hypothetical protein BDV95DRAFT_480473 [Massariosphaeria phaeospora]